MQVDKYFLQFSRDLAYLDLKKEAASSFLTPGLPLPIRTFDFIEGLKENRLDQSIDLSYFLKGMVWNLGIDPDFKFAPEYKEILKKAIQEPDRFACQLALEDKNPDHSRIAFRAALELNPENHFARVHLASLFYSYAMDSSLEKDREAFIKEASRLYEEVLQAQEDNVFANTGLGQINEGLGHYLKAKAYYQRALAAAPREEIREEIRQAIRAIEPQAFIEDGIYYLNRANYEKAIEAFNQAKKDQTRYDVYYYLGTAFQNLERYREAEESFKMALEKGGDFEDLYNGLVYNLNAEGKIDEALKYANLGLDRHPSGLRLRFNRAILLAVLGNRKKALEDLDFLLGYSDLSDEFFSQSMTLKEEILKEMEGEGPISS